MYYSWLPPSWIFIDFVEVPNEFEHLHVTFCPEYNKTHIKKFYFSYFDKKKPARSSDLIRVKTFPDTRLDARGFPLMYQSTEFTFGRDDTSHLQKN